MNVALIIADTLVILAFLGLIVVLVALVFAGLRLKRDVMRNAKRLYERPTNSVTSIINAGKGIVVRETPRVQHAISTVQATAEVVKATVEDTRIAVSTIRDVDWGPIIEMAQTGMKFASLAAAVARASSKQGASAE